MFVVPPIDGLASRSIDSESPVAGGTGRQRVLILNDRAFDATTLQQVVAAVLPRAETFRTAKICEAASLLAVAPVDLLITNLDTADGDVFDLLLALHRQPDRVRATLVVATHSEPRLLQMLHKLDIAGVFDAISESPSQLAEALRDVAGGRKYWSQDLLERLRRKSDQVGSLACLLTPYEELVLAVIGDGSDDTTAAVSLGIKPSAVHSIRRNLHRKLGVQYRSGLIQVAVRYGVVRFTENGVVRPGLALLRAACGRSR